MGFGKWGMVNSYLACLALQRVFLVLIVLVIRSLLAMRGMLLDMSILPPSVNANFSEVRGKPKLQRGNVLRTPCASR